MDPKELFAAMPNTTTLTYAASSPTDPDDFNAVAEKVTLVISFSEKGVGFGEFSLVQTKEGVFVDTEYMGLDRMKRAFAALLENAITEYDETPAKHLLYNRARGRRCGGHCRVCYPDMTPWQPTEQGDYRRFFNPHDGRTWSNDGSPRWVALVSPCCEGEAEHWTWSVQPRDKSEGEYQHGSEKTLEEAQAKADEACRSFGWVLPPKPGERPEWMSCIRKDEENTWCGRPLDKEWAFRDRERAESNLASGARLTPCPECMAASEGQAGG